MSWLAPSGVIGWCGNRHRPGRAGLRLHEPSQRLKEEDAESTGPWKPQETVRVAHPSQPRPRCLGKVTPTQPGCHPGGGHAGGLAARLPRSSSPRALAAPRPSCCTSAFKSTARIAVGFTRAVSPGIGYAREPGDPGCVRNRVEGSGQAQYRKEVAKHNRRHKELGRHEMHKELGRHKMWGPAEARIPGRFRGRAPHFVPHISGLAGSEPRAPVPAPTFRTFRAWPVPSPGRFRAPVPEHPAWGSCPRYSPSCRGDPGIRN